jgi:predicted permease
MKMKMVIVPLTFVSFAVFLGYTEPHTFCVVMVLAKLAGHMSL